MRAGVAIGVLVLCGCNPGPRAQALVYVDTDLPIPGFADVLRVEQLDAAGNVTDEREQVAPDPADWPLSFGLAAPARVRLRLYPSTKVSVGGAPLPASAVDRIVDVTLPSGGVRPVEVRLDGACLGVPADPVTGASCVDGALGPASAGVQSLEGDGPPASTSGTWADATPIRCPGTPRGDGAHDEAEVCIPGGVFFLGDQRLFANACEPACTAVPELLVRLSPFYLDREEVTVGRWRAALARGFQPPADSYLVDYAACTYRESGLTDGYPMSCVTQAGARAFCQFDGGRDLPLEAQWEYAASGRGDERMYVWGDLPLPRCELATYARASIGLNGVPRPGSPTECAALGSGPKAIGTTPADVSRDGVLDLEGSLKEWTRDLVQRYGVGCWSSPSARDPVCESGVDGVNHTIRGGSWASGSGQLAVAGRDGRKDDQNDPNNPSQWLGPVFGFRCARPAVAP